jgi:hypothetical protein
VTGDTPQFQFTFMVNEEEPNNEALYRLAASVEEDVPDCKVCTSINY